MKIKIYKVVYSEWFLGWIIEAETRWIAGPYQDHVVVDYPDKEELRINSYKTEAEAIAVMEELKNVH